MTAGSEKTGSRSFKQIRKYDGPLSPYEHLFKKTYTPMYHDNMTIPNGQSFTSRYPNVGTQCSEKVSVRDYSAQHRETLYR